MNPAAHIPLNIFASKEISMNTFVKSILVSSILSIAVTTPMVAQPGNSQFDQWYRAKYGRPAPTQQVIVKTPQIDSIAQEAVQPTVPATNFEHWYRAKYGRPSPTEQALATAPQVNSASSEAMPPMVMPVAVSDKEVAANTPAEHQRIAQSYRDQAQDYMAQAKQHQAMIVAYKASPNVTSKNQAATIDHCVYFVAKFNEMAAKSIELAQLHDQMAKVAATR
jgi:hypothetical protein